MKISHLRKATLVMAFFALVSTSVSYAAPVTGFTPGRIIDDGVFAAYTSMNPNQIQSFLNSKVPSCDTNGTQPSEYGGGTRAQWGTSHGHPPPYTCIKDYTEGGRNAAQIIFDTAQLYRINPQVFIVLLQKEQGLVTDTWPLDTQYRTATGYGCPDTAPCDSQYYGLTNQLNWSGKMFRAILDASPTWYTPYVLGTNFIRWSPNSACGGSNVNIENRATQALYNYTPYQPNQSALNAGYGTGDSCGAYGNRNFYLYFSDWFGNTKLPTIFTTASSTNIYAQASGYKFYVPSVDILKDWGLGTGAQSISQNMADSIPLGDSGSGLSDTLGNVVKSPSDSDSDGGNIYLISAGKRYLFRTMQQIQDFGFSVADIRYLPLDFISRVQDGGVMNNYVQATDSYFYLYSGGVRRLVPEGPAFASAHSYDAPSQINSNLLALVPASTPLSDREVLIRTTNGTIYLYRNDKYFYVPSADALSCWGFDSALNTQKFWLAYDSAIGNVANTQTLKCDFNVGGVDYAMNGLNRIVIPSNYSFSLSTLDAALTDTVARMPVRQAQLGRAVQSTSSPVVWYLENGERKGIPSLADLNLLGINGGGIDRVLNGAVTDLPLNGGVKFGVGQVVKAADSAGVYVITSPTSKRLITTPDQFTAYGYSWGGLSSFPTNLLNSYYPSEPSPYLSNYLYTDSGGVYLMDTYRCYGISSTQISSFGIPATKASTNQTYSNSIFPYVNLARCTTASIYLKNPTNSTIFLLDSGQKRPISTWNKLVQHSGTSNPYIINVTQSTLDSFITGSAY